MPVRQGLTPTKDAVSYDIAKMIVYGHSLAFGGGATDPDRDVMTHLASMLKAREIPRGVGGAILHWHQSSVSPGDGGYAHMLQTDVRTTRSSTTLNGAVSAGAGTITVTNAATAGITVGKLIHVGTGSTSGTGGEVLWVTAVATNVLTIVRTDLTTASTARAHSTGEPVYVVPSGYINLNPLYLIWYGLNDLGVSPIASDDTQIGATFTEPLRLAIARARCAEVFENDHASCVYTGTWGAVTASATLNSGPNVRQPTAVNAAVTIHVPDNFPGGTVVLGFVAGGEATTNMPVWTFTVDGVAAGTKQPGAGFTAKANGYCMRFTGLAAGRHQIVATLTTLGSKTVYFDWWGVEAPNPPVVIVPGANRPGTYGTWSTWTNRRSTTTLTGTHGIGVSSFTVASTSNMAKGQSVTFEEGVANAETLEVLTVPTGTTFTTTTATTKSHAGATGVVYGMQDASVPKLNLKMQAVVAEFDNKVRYVDIDSVVAKDPNYFASDGAHFNDAGQAILTQTMYEAIQSAMTVTTASYTSVPTAPLPAMLNFANNPGSAAGANTQWTNMPAALTELFGVAAHRKYVDLRRVYEARFIVGVQVAGVSGSSLRIRYSIDGGTTWKYLFRTAAYAEDTTHEALLTSTGMKDSGWRPIAAEAIADNVLLSVWGINGNGTADPTFGTIDIYFR